MALALQRQVLHRGPVWAEARCSPSKVFANRKTQCKTGSPSSSLIEEGCFSNFGGSKNLASYNNLLPVNELVKILGFPGVQLKFKDILERFEKSVFAGERVRIWLGLHLMNSLGQAKGDVDATLIPSSKGHWVCAPETAATLSHWPQKFNRPALAEATSILKSRNIWTLCLRLPSPARSIVTAEHRLGKRKIGDGAGAAGKHYWKIGNQIGGRETKRNVKYDVI